MVSFSKILLLLSFHFDEQQKNSAILKHLYGRLSNILHYTLSESRMPTVPALLYTQLDSRTDGRASQVHSFSQAVPGKMEELDGHVAASPNQSSFHFLFPCLTPKDISLLTSRVMLAMLLGVSANSSEVSCTCRAWELWACVSRQINIVRCGMRRPVWVLA